MEAHTPSQFVGITIHGYSLPLEAGTSVIVAVKIAIFGLEPTFGPRIILNKLFQSRIGITKYIVFFKMITLPSLAAGPPRVVAFVNLRGILASRHLIAMDAMVTEIEDAQRVEVDFEYLNMTEKHPSTSEADWIQDYEADYYPPADDDEVDDPPEDDDDVDDPPDDDDAVEMDPATPRAELRSREVVNTGSSSYAPALRPPGLQVHPGSSSYASALRPPGLQKDKKKDHATWDCLPEDAGLPGTKIYAAEWHCGKRLTMRDLKTNMSIFRVDKRTHYLCSPLHIRVFYAAVLQCRERAIEEYMDMVSLDAARVYVPHEFQQCIRDAIQLWYMSTIASEESSGWQNYLKLGAKGDRKLAERSYYRNWKHQVFGKDWIFDFFVGFGWLDEHMLTALNESCDFRAKVAEAELASTQNTTRLDGLSDLGRARAMGLAAEATLAATKNTTQLGCLSAIGRARVMKFPIPAVEGMTHTISYAAVARADAREVEGEVRSLERMDTVNFKETGTWTKHDSDVWKDRRSTVDHHWKEAHALSLAAGHNFMDRDGVMQKIAPEGIVERAVRTYLEKIPWPTVQRMKKKYVGKPQEKHWGDKKGDKKGQSWKRSQSVR